MLFESETIKAADERYGIAAAEFVWRRVSTPPQQQHAAKHGRHGALDLADLALGQHARGVEARPTDRRWRGDEAERRIAAAREIQEWLNKGRSKRPSSTAQVDNLRPNFPALVPGILTLMR